MGYKSRLQNQSSTGGYVNRMTYPGTNVKLASQKDNGVVARGIAAFVDGKEQPTRLSEEYLDLSDIFYPIQYWNFQGPKELSYIATLGEGIDEPSPSIIGVRNLHTAITKTPASVPPEWLTWVNKTQNGGAPLEKNPKSGIAIQCIVLVDRGKPVDPKYGKNSVLIGSSSVKTAMEDLLEMRDEKTGKLLYPDLFSSKKGQAFRICAGAPDPKSGIKSYQAIVEGPVHPISSEEARNLHKPWAEIIKYPTKEQHVAYFTEAFGKVAASFVFKDDEELSQYLSDEVLNAWDDYKRKSRQKLLDEARREEEALRPVAPVARPRTAPRAAPAAPIYQDEYEEEVEEAAQEIEEFIDDTMEPTDNPQDGVEEVVIDEPAEEEAAMEVEFTDDDLPPEEPEPPAPAPVTHPLVRRPPPGAAVGGAQRQPGASLGGVPAPSARPLTPAPVTRPVARTTAPVPPKAAAVPPTPGFRRGSEGARNPDNSVTRPIARQTPPRAAPPVRPPAAAEDDENTARLAEVARIKNAGRKK